MSFSRTSFSARFGNGTIVRILAEKQIDLITFGSKRHAWHGLKDLGAKHVSDIGAKPLSSPSAPGVELNGLLRSDASSSCRPAVACLVTSSFLCLVVMASNLFI